MLLLAGFVIFINTEFGQNWITKKVTQRLSKDLNTHISIGKVSFGLFNKMNLEDLLIEDRVGDTLVDAGALQVRVTDWFFLKDNVVLEYIGLEDANIHLKRTGEEWNYQFLADYFSTPADTTKNKKGVEFNFKELDLKNVSFLKEDQWIGQDMKARVDELSMHARSVDFKKKKIDIADLTLDKPYFQLHNYDGLRPENKNAGATPEVVIADSTLRWNPEHWLVNVTKVKISNGEFANDRDTEREIYSSFDGQHILFRDINANFTDVAFRDDSLFAKANVTTKERSGFEVKEMTANIKMHPEAMEFSKLHIRTNHSELGDYFAMRYKEFDDMNDFLHKVRMEANFKNTRLDSDDIAYFAPALSTWDKRIVVNGQAQGSVDELNADNMIIQAGSNTYLNGDISLSGLPDIDQTFIDFRANDFRTDYADAVRFIPTLKSIGTPNLAALGFLHFNGSFTGFIRDFVTYGTIQSNLGTVTTDVNMKLPANRPPQYSGSLSTNNFRLGTFIRDTTLGSISFDGDIRGRGFQWNTLEANIKGDIAKLGFNGYTYTNIATNARISRKLFDGLLTIDDPNAQLELNGEIDFNEELPKFNLLAEVQKANLQALKLTRQDLAFHGNFNLDFQGNNIDNFYGIARINEASLLRNGERMSFDSLVVSSAFENGVKKFEAHSNEFDAIVSGDYNFIDLTDAFKLFLNKYYPAYIPKPRKTLTNEHIAFDITTRNVDEYINLIDDRLSGFNNSQVSGALDLSSNSLAVDALVPYFSYNNISFSNLLLNGDGNLDRLIVTGTVENSTFGDSLYLPQTTFRVEAHDDVSLVNVSTSANRTINDAKLSATVQTFTDGAKIVFDPTSFVINGKQWTVAEGGELEFRSNNVAQGSLLLRESFQEIRLFTTPSGEGNWNDLDIRLKNVNIGDFSPYLTNAYRFEGALSGRIKIEDPNNRFNVSADLDVAELRIDDDSLGRVKAEVAYNNQTGELTGKGHNFDPDQKLSFDARMFLKDSLRAADDRISVDVDHYQVKPLERFIGTLFSDLEGYATGHLDIIGAGKDQQYIGKAKLQDAGLRVNYTQCFYKLDDTEINLRENELDFGKITLRDKFGKTATLQGSIKHKAWSDLYFDLNAQVDDQPLEVLNTGPSDNPNFYGHAFSTGSFSLLGSEDDLYMSIYAKASETDSSRIVLPNSESRESGIADFLVEKKYGREMSDSLDLASNSNVTYDIDLSATPMVTVEVILDEQTGDVIKGRGNGNLTMRVSSTEDLTIRGRYNILEGNYLFTFQSFLRKPFEIKEGATNYIEWTGDPYKALINITAVYRAEEVNFSSLSAQNVTDPGSRVAREDVFVVAHLTDELFKPSFEFSLEFPQNSVVVNDASLAFSLQQIQANQNELKKQVTYLIVFNSFAPVQGLGTGSSGNYVFNEFAYSTISGLFFNEVNKRLNELLSQVIQNSDLQVNFSGSLYNRNLFTTASNNRFNINQGNFNLTVGRSFFDDRFNITVGSTLDVPLQSSISQTVTFLPDVTVEWLINQSGTIRATLFYRQDLDFITNTANTGAKSNRSGASLAYRKEFDRIGEIFGKKKKAPLVPQQPAEPTDSATKKDAVILERRKNEE